jgi:hypothetical protein
VIYHLEQDTPAYPPPIRSARQIDHAILFAVSTGDNADDRKRVLGPEIKTRMMKREGYRLGSGLQTYIMVMVGGE